MRFKFGKLSIFTIFLTLALVIPTIGLVPTMMSVLTSIMGVMAMFAIAAVPKEKAK